MTTNEVNDKSISAQESFYDDYWQRRRKTLNTSEVERLGHVTLAMALVRRETQGREFEICDLGCGLGWLSNELVKYGKVTGVDLSPEGIRLAQERWPGVSSFVAADILAWRPAEKFDLIVSSEVIEHIPDKEAFARTVEHLLKPGGHLVLTTPNGHCKQAWDRGRHGEQMIEEWVTPGQLRGLFSSFLDTRSHYTFEYDYLYTGVFRFTSAPKLLGLLRALRLGPLWNGVRRTLDMGLYQIYVGRRR